MMRYKKILNILIYPISWILNIIYAILFSWDWVISFSILVKKYNYVHGYYHLYKLIIYLILLLLLNIFIPLTLHFLKLNYHKIFYWSVNLVLALFPYVWFILCCIDNYIRYGSF